MKSRAGCCADQRKPCSYHEGYADATDAAEEQLSEALKSIADQELMRVQISDLRSQVQNRDAVLEVFDDGAVVAMLAEDREEAEGRALEAEARVAMLERLLEELVAAVQSETRKHQQIPRVSQAIDVATRALQDSPPLVCTGNRENILRALTHNQWCPLHG